VCCRLTHNPVIPERKKKNNETCLRLGRPIQSCRHKGGVKKRPMEMGPRDCLDCTQKRAPDLQEKGAQHSLLNRRVVTIRAVKARKRCPKKEKSGDGGEAVGHLQNGGMKSEITSEGGKRLKRSSSRETRVLVEFQVDLLELRGTCHRAAGKKLRPQGESVNPQFFFFGKKKKGDHRFRVQEKNCL